MDGLKTKKKLYAGLGDYARQMRGQQMRKKYSTGIDALDKQMESEDEAVEKAEMPGLPKGQSHGKGFTLTIGVGDVAKDAEKWQDENAAALDELADEEEQKWMKKQRG